MKTKTRWIPEGYVKYAPETGDYPKDLFEVFVDLEKKTAIFYTGKQSRHTWFNRFSTLDEMKKKINETISRLMSWEDRKAERRAARKLPHSLKVGDILYSSWGYDQTNIDFYQVTAVVGDHSVKIREISSHVDHGDMGADYVSAMKDTFIGKEMLKRVSPSNGINISSYEYASPWDGTPKYETALGWGH